MDKYRQTVIYIDEKKEETEEMEKDDDKNGMVIWYESIKIMT